MDARLGTPWASTSADESPDVPPVFVLVFVWLLLCLMVVGLSDIEES